MCCGLQSNMKVSSEMLFECGKCGIGFSQRESLSKHMRFHMTDRFCSCSDCCNKHTPKDNRIEATVVHDEDQPVIHTIEPLHPNTPDASYSRSSEELHPNTPDASSSRSSEELHPNTPDSSYSRSSEEGIVDNSTEISVCSSDCEMFDIIFSPRVIVDSGKGSNNFDCHECGKVFSQKGNLNQHLLIHSGEKPYKCVDCVKTFTLKGDLVKHVRSHKGEQPYVCKKCGKRFSQNSSLNTHLLTHTMGRSYKCTHCEKHFPTKRDLSKHSHVHVDERPYFCRKCGKAFTEKGKLMRHLLAHSCSQPFYCSLCGKAFTQKYNLHQHMIIHSIDRQRCCYKCEKTFLIGNDASIQQDTAVDNVDNSMCKECDFGTLEEKWFHHKVTSNLQGTDDFDGSFTFPKEDSVLSPSEVCSSVTEGIYLIADSEEKCDCSDASSKEHYCLKHGAVISISDNSISDLSSENGKTYSEIRHLSSDTVIYGHSQFLGEDKAKTLELAPATQVITLYGDSQILNDLSDGHSNAIRSIQDVNYEDDSYNRQTTKETTDNQIPHTEIASRVGLPPHSQPIEFTDSFYSCSVCDKKFSLETELSGHLSVCAKSSLYECLNCGKSFSSREKLKRHMLVHTGERPYACSVCGKAFALKGNLTQHMFIHSGEKSHQCHVCGNLFSHRNDLNKHILTCHKHVKRHECRECGKKFYFKAKLKRHQLVHSKTRYHYSCDECGRTFSRKETFVEHLQTHSAKPPNKCDECGKVFSLKGNLKKHMLFHKRKKSRVCKYCGVIFSNVNKLKKHSCVHD